MAGSQARGTGPKYRRSLRKAVRAQVRLGDESGLGDIYLDSRDLSNGGAFIASDILFEIGEELDLELTLPESQTRVRARGRVVWVNRRDEGDEVPGMGVQFIDLSDEDKAALAEFIGPTIHQ